ncbi:hypothetical protein PInf_014272 [Phytophthora infestans]|nr:hypothetical protein PInf_014272 [Phytophthora infestans]
MAISKNTEVDAALQDPNHGELGKIIEEVRAAASEWGFFYVANHGLSEQEVGGFQTAMRAFFRLSKQIKRTIHRNTTNNRGYVEGELTKNKTDWKECFDFAGSGEDGPVTGKNDRLGEDRNQWLDETTLPGFRRKMRAYYDKMEHVACRLLKGTYTINIGDMMQVWSNDQFVAPLHRVVASKEAARFSAPFFYSPSYDVQLVPIPLARFQGNYADLGKENQIGDYKIHGPIDFGNS